MLELLIIAVCIYYFISRNPDLKAKIREAFSGNGKNGRAGEKGDAKGPEVVDADGNPYKAPREKTPVDLGPLKRVVKTVLILLVLGAIAFGSYYNVNEQEVAVVTMFGKVLRTDTAGLHFKIPFLQRVHMVDITTHGTGLGYQVSDDGQSFASDTDGIMITKDFNFINIDFYMEYKVSDPVAYLYNSEEPEQILKNIALASIRSTVINYDVDDAITTGKTRIQSEVRETMTEELALQNIGLAVVNITVQDAQPPTTEIIQAFKAVETAKQGKDTAVNNANKYRNEQVPAAEAEADRILRKAEAAKAARIAEAEGQTARFNAMYTQYQQNPLITKQRMFYETMEDVLPGMKVIITDGTTQQILPLESFTAPAAAETQASGSASQGAASDADS